MDKLILVFLLSVAVAMVTGSCFIAPPTLEPDGTMLCKLQGNTYEVGTSLTTPDCFNCYCSRRGLHCCGFGIRAGVRHRYTPPGCKWLVEGCTERLVDEDDESQDCTANY